MTEMAKVPIGLIRGKFERGEPLTREEIAGLIVAVEYLRDENKSNCSWRPAAGEKPARRWPDKGMPGDSVDVLVWTSDGEAWVGWWDSEVERWDGPTGAIAGVTHWAPIPDAPEPHKPLHSPVSHPSGVGPDASGVTHGKDSGERVEGPQQFSGSGGK